MRTAQNKIAQEQLIRNVFSNIRSVYLSSYVKTSIVDFKFVKFVTVDS